MRRRRPWSSRWTLQVIGEPGNVSRANDTTSDEELARATQAGSLGAFEELVHRYEVKIFEFLRYRVRGLHDAQDLTQQVLASVAGAIQRWEPDPAKGRFRSWLSRIVRNAVINAVTRRHPDVPVGGSDMLQLLEQQPDSDDASEQDFDHEYRRAVFRWAQDQIRLEFHESTWNAFWLTTVEGQSVEQAAEQLDKSLGSVYAARSRVMRRLKEAVRQFEGSEDSIV